ncbi:hypothetical protein LTR56_015475 [Elasticomyces elasticus]|nr:hypothetical protein LTR56_015475 [Elasticomyces elasticus]KAK4906110.1 hypothetical protein LTR49_024694 [Elasticomyces elasticus]KAK5754903.1 hypothetical protein LTS12_015026 [Elasticomyces elasticus]
MSLILIASSLALNIIATLSGVALLGSYLTSISTLVYRRLSGFQLPRTRFSQGRYGLPINLATVVLDFFAFVMTLNWAVLIFGAVVIYALGFYFVRTKHVYRAPAQITRPEAEIEMSPGCEEKKF